MQRSLELLGDGDAALLFGDTDRALDCYVRSIGMMMKRKSPDRDCETLARAMVKASRMLSILGRHGDAYDGLRFLLLSFVRESETESGSESDERRENAVGSLLDQLMALGNTSPADYPFAFSLVSYVNNNQKYNVE